MASRLLRRIEYRIPVRPSAAPTTQVQIIFDSAPDASATTPAATQHMVPIDTRVMTDVIVDLAARDMEEE
jgi:hypothetical protein